ncbi:hypothetical protein CDH05_15510 [Pseudomonas lactis]|nr:hypothetical protein CDH05_15510 [Pseudomonas lactis]
MHCPQNQRLSQVPVGASLLARSVNDNARFLNERGAYEFFASKLAPTKAAVLRQCGRFQPSIHPTINSQTAVQKTPCSVQR